MPSFLATVRRSTPSTTETCAGNTSLPTLTSPSSRTTSCTSSRNSSAARTTRASPWCCRFG
eukprot:7125797-Pyramimonas_sp.AAC.1